jgi:hypothetical protein
MRIDRSNLINELHLFSQGGNGIVIGAPGAGKSYALSQLSDTLWDKKIPSYIIKVDEIEGTPKSICMDLGVEDNWIESLDKIAVPDTNVKAILIFDAFDAARDESQRYQFLFRIKEAITGLKKWNVIVSVRTFDAAKSSQLLKLFGVKNLESKIPCRYFEVNDLNENELNSAFVSNPQLGSVFELVSDEFKDILKTPFFLKLLERVLFYSDSTKDAESLLLAKSKTELLQMFWENRIANTENAYNKELLLKQISNQLVQNKTLRYLKDKFIENYYTFKELRSDDIIVEVGVGDRYVAFSHNIFFDYIVGRLVIPVEPRELVEFIEIDKSRQFFLRPSFVYHFTHLWHYHRNLFWQNYRYLENMSDVHLSLFKRLLLFSVIANEFKTIKDIEIVLYNNNSVNHLLQSIQFINDRPLRSRDVDLMETLSTKLDSATIWEFSQVFAKLVESDNFNQGEFGVKVGFISRKFLQYIILERDSNLEKKYLLDRLGSAKGVEFVARTYHTDPVESRRLFRQVLQFINHPNFEIRYLSTLSDAIRFFVQIDPLFVAEVYLAIFRHKEDSDAATNMHGTVLFNLVSNRRQDFELNYYRLVEFFPTYLESSPEIAIKTGLAIVNEYVIEDKLHLPIVDDLLQTVQILDIHANFLADRSSIWHDSLTYHVPAQLEEKIILYLKSVVLAGDLEKLKALLHLYFSHALVGFTWKKIIEFANDFPNVFKDYLFQLALSKIILTSDDTTYEIGVSLQKIYAQLKAEQREKIEATILDLWTVNKNINREQTEYKINRLLNCIPRGLLQKDESKTFIGNSAIVENKPLFRTSWSIEPYTTNDWLAEQGVDLADGHNNRVYHLINQLEAFNSRWLNETPSRIQFEQQFPVANELFLLIKLSKDVSVELFDSALREVTKFYSIISRNALVLKYEEYQIAKEAILYGLEFVSEHDEMFDETSSPSSGYSPTPRIEAASGLVGLFLYRSDELLLNFIQKYGVDPNPIVRFNIFRNIYSIWSQKPNEFWDLIFDRLLNESDSFTLAAVLSNVNHVLHNASLSNVAEPSNETIAAIVKICSTRLVEFEEETYFFEAYAVLLIFLIEIGHSEIVQPVIKNNLDKYNFTRSVVSKLFEFLIPENLSDNHVYELNHKKLFQLLAIINRSNLDLLKGIELPIYEGESSAKRRLQLVDFVIQKIYMALNANGRTNKSSEVITDEINRRTYFNKVKPILIDIIESSNEIGNGIMLAHSAYYFMGILNTVIKLHPQEASLILKMAAQITKLSSSTGYTFDSLAIQGVISLTERLLADHRQLLRDNDNLNYLVSILNIYVESGWPKALELLWGLDEVFK